MKTESTETQEKKFDTLEEAAMVVFNEYMANYYGNFYLTQDGMDHIESLYDSVREDPRFQNEAEKFKKHFMDAIKKGATMDDLEKIRLAFENFIEDTFRIDKFFNIPRNLSKEMADEAGGENYKKAYNDWILARYRKN